MISTKQFQVGELLPSTRDLGRQLDASFHTVRKAYHLLVEEGLVEGEPGKGFLVKQQSGLLDKEKRLELGAEKVQRLIEELMGYGLDDSEIEVLFQEQLSFLEWPDRIQTSASVGENKEMGKMLADAIQKEVGIKSKILEIGKIDEAINYDALFVPIKLIHLFHHLQDSLLIIPIIYGFNPDTLLSIASQAAIQTIGLVTGTEECIPTMINELKSSIKFDGSYVAGSIYGRALPLFVRETDLILYTPESAKFVEPKVPEKNRIKLVFKLSDRSAEMIRSELWDQ